MTTITATITDPPYNCPTNGTSDCRAAFLAFKADAQGKDAILTVPAGSYQFLLNLGPNEDYHLFNGMKSLVLHGTGASFGIGALGTGGYFLGSQGVWADNFHHANVRSAFNGDPSVTLITAAEVSRFSVGQWVLLGALDLEGTGSAPPNPYYFIYRQIESITGTTTKVITFTEPITGGPYLDTFPNYGMGSISDYYQGGPATIYAMPPSWDAEFQFIGLDATNSAGQIFARVRKLTLTSCTNSVGAGIIPSQNLECIWDACNFGIGVEVDKLVSIFRPGNGTVAHRLVFQSSSPEQTISRGGLTVESGIVGTGKHTDYDNVTALMQIGTTAFGFTETFRGTNCDFSAGLSALGVVEGDITNPAGGRRYTFGPAFTCTNGLISIPLTAGPVAWAVPRRRMMFQGGLTNEIEFHIISVGTDGTNTLIQTTLPAGFLPVPFKTGTQLDLMGHPCESLYLSNCTGTVAADLSQTGAQNKPLYSYSKRVYTAADLNATLQIVPVWGEPTQINITVTGTFTAAGALTLRPLGQFISDTLDMATYAVPSPAWNPTVNLLVPGTRTYTKGAGWGATAKSGDTLVDPGRVWFAGRALPYCSATAGGSGTVTVEIITDQGFPNLIPMSLRLRLHA